ncbi:MAG: inorganic phosphate transporter [Bacteroidetes bacterium]|nr:inorganic phosphate transporter [Bacteroidota bacterium]
MPELYLIIVILLFVLAISDLIVGVSNDAVNFINSAMGSKVASRNVVMIVASIGIFAGATFSSGMMEVARKGIFNPDYFYFSEIMLIFLAVMLTDIILLDMFNTLGLPTSTTVSIVFELLGAAVVVSLIKILSPDSGMDLTALADHINTTKAIQIIVGIFLSVGVAFIVGAFVQYLSRLLFSFHFEKRMHYVGTLWSGLALAGMTYFLLIKGVKGASFVSAEFIDYVKHNTLLLLFLSFIFWSIVMQVLVSVFKVNILRIVVLFGTFALAMAFAGNDLVNFIGVPIAGFESYNAWIASGVGADEFSMSFLNEAVRTKTYLLVIAGAIMIATLWMSKKARSVAETEINLARQTEGDERFSPNAISRGIVRFFQTLSKGISKGLPSNLAKKIENSFQPKKTNREVKKKVKNPPAFDMVRASVNLTVASALIAFATSLKLPLSTTYVSFMVAMGTSLADRAWGRDSAVYRVTGVLSVVLGWFMTALIAFSVSGVFAFFIYHYGPWAIGILVTLAIFLLTRSFIYHKKKEKEKVSIRKYDDQTDSLSAEKVIGNTSEHVTGSLASIRKALQGGINGLIEEDRHKLQDAWESIKEVKHKNKALKYGLYSSIQRINESQAEGSRLYLMVYDLERDIVQSTTIIVNACRDHVENMHNPLDEKQAEKLKDVCIKTDEYLGAIINKLNEGGFEQSKEIMAGKQELLNKLETLLSDQVGGIKTQTYGVRNSLLFFSLLLEYKDLIAVAARFVKLYRKITRQVEYENTSPSADKPDTPEI